MTNITVVGLGYVGLANSILLARHHNVRALDIDKARVDAVNAKKCPIHDQHMQQWLTHESMSLTASLDASLAYDNADYVIICTPTNYNNNTACFDTSSVESVIAQAQQLAPKALIIIKSTVPIGFTQRYKNVIFSPEFLREGSALYDNLYPSRIVVGERSERARAFAELLSQAAIACDVPIILTNPSEAEAIKLFSNSYLALRVAFFNELDTYALHKNLNAKRIIQGVSLDPRIGDHYNNPSFGYGGYCLPKDSLQLLSHYRNIPQKLLSALPQSNYKRKQAIVDCIVNKNYKTVGIYRLIMKAHSDNFRDSAMHDIIAQLVQCGVNVLIYEPNLSAYQGAEVISDIHSFKQRCDVILANRMTDELSDVEHAVFTRDIFNKD